ncbi:MutS protein msh4 [Actinomortierella wolfii]|nr:MutS protein msh4 [Actinomortierella wolfii]
MSDSQTYVRTLQKFSVYPPTEILVPRTAIETKVSKLTKCIKDSFPNVVITPLPRRYFNDAQGLEYIQQYIVPESSSTLLVGIQTKYFCLAATAALVKHIETSRNALFLNHSIRFKYQGCHGSMLVDHATARNLELAVNMSNNREKHSLLGVLNHTCTSMGSRLLRTNILQPLNDETTIQTRLNCVQELLEKEDTFMAVRQALKPFLDLDRLITAFVQVPSKPSIKHSEQAINNIIQLKHSLKLIHQLASSMAECKNKLFITIHRLLTDSRLAYCLQRINHVIEENVTFEKTAIGLRNQRCFAVKAGFNGLLDVARQTYKEIVNDTFDLVNSYVETYNLTLKIQFNNTTGYYLAMSTDQVGHRDSINSRSGNANDLGGELPNIFINVVKKNKTLNFTTLELMKKNSKIEDSLVEVYLMSDKIAQDLSSEIRTNINAIYKASEAIAMLDMLVAFAHQCTLHDYVRPEFGDTLVLQQARHPIREVLYSEPFVPNDTYASFAHSFQIITGPNMSGKSTYLRQIALIHIMAQIGSYVPAEFACLKIADQLFTRICNDDSIEVNASTFTVEMREIAYILQNITDKSLVIIDELGRGTSTHDGMGIAFAVCEVLAQARAFVFFATHFHELASTLTVYHNVLRMEGNAQPTMVFKYRVTDGRAQEEHYGLTLAKMMRLPSDVLERASDVSKRLKSMVESWRDASKSSEVIQFRRRLAQLAHRMVLVKQNAAQLEPTEIAEVLRDIQAKALLELMDYQHLKHSLRPTYCHIKTLLRG